MSAYAPSGAPQNGYAPSPSQQQPYANGFAQSPTSYAQSPIDSYAPPPAPPQTKELDEDAFGPSAAAKAVQAFDAFPKTKPSYTQKTSSGGIWTIVLVIASMWLASTELGRWWKGDTTHEFSVEQGVGHDLQINLDVVVRMKCDDLHINVQDASGDRILAGQALSKDPTRWGQWTGEEKVSWTGAAKEARKDKRVKKLGATREQREASKDRGEGKEYKEEDVHDYLGATRSSKTFKKTPRLPRKTEADSCRIYGSMHSNKVQGDFHITARGHGYMEFGQHLDHNTFNFSHTINELSFGPFYPSLVNPLDLTTATTDNNFQKFQYYLSVVPTIYTTDSHALRKITKQQQGESATSGSDGLAAHPKKNSRKTVFTNQYAVTEQSHPVPENSVPGVFVKYDIEPIMLTIAEEWSSVPALFIRLVNVISGVLVAGGWCFQISEWGRETVGRRRQRGNSYAGLMTPLDEKKSMM